MSKRLLLIIFVCFCGTAKAQLRPFYSAESDRYGYEDPAGKVVVRPKYDFAWMFREGLSTVKLNGKYGYVDEKGCEAIPPKYDDARLFSDGLAVVRIGEKYGFIDKSGKLVVPAIYDRADNFHGDRANVSLDKRWTVMIYSQKSGQP